MLALSFVLIMAFDANNSSVRRGRDGKAIVPISAQQLFEKQPPQALEAEMSLLGSMILDPRIIPDVLPFVRKGEDFYSESNGAVFKAIVDLYDQRNSGDLVQLIDMLRDRHVLDTIGGVDYLEQLAASVPTSVNAPHFAKIVGEKAKLRRLIDTAGSILYDAYHVGELGPEGAREVLDRAEMAVFEIAQEQAASDPQSLAELLELELQRIEAQDFGDGSMSGVATGYYDLDDKLRGMQPGELIVLAARPSMGKTALALNLAEQMACGGIASGQQATKRVPVGIFSLEMSKQALVQRMLSARSGVSGQLLRGGTRMGDKNLRDLMMAADELKAAPIYIDDSPDLTVLNLRARARRMVAQHGVKAIMIDYLQLMSSPGAARESRQVEVSAISRGVKALARELKVPILCLSQLNRASESREGNRPRMSDLRESGSIEQDADVILLLHREEYYHVQDESWKQENPDKVGIAEIIIAKQRNGPTGVVKLYWDNNTTRFKNYDSHMQSPGGMGGMGGASDMHDPFADAPRTRPQQPSSQAGGFGNASYASPSGAAEAAPWTQAAASGGSAAGSAGGSSASSRAQPPASPSGFGDAGFGDSGFGGTGFGGSGFAGFDELGEPSGGGQSQTREVKPAPPAGSAFGNRPKKGLPEYHRDGGGSDQRPDMP
jgi:replicative DNA helicase